MDHGDAHAEVPGPWLFLSMRFHFLNLSSRAGPTDSIQVCYLNSAETPVWDAWLSSLGPGHHQASQARYHVSAFLFS